MATNFNENSIVSSGGFKPSSKDTPLDIRTRVETEQDIYEIPNPYIGMIVYVKDTGKRFEILTLKEVDMGLTTKNVVDTYKQFTVDLEEYAKIEDVPTKVSELENDKGYLVNQDISGKADVEDIPTKVSELENDRGYATERFVDSKIETINNTVNSNINTINTELDDINTDLIGVSESIEGSWISVDSKDGYLKDIEILGNTIQNQNNLADIRSVGDKLENQELYEIPVLSCGKNLNKSQEFGRGINQDGSYNPIGENNVTDYCNVKGNTQYTTSINGVLRGANQFYYDKDKKFISKSATPGVTFTTPQGAKYVRLTFGFTQEGLIQLEEGTTATPYEPYQEHKLTILSPVQLEKVGDVADRIVCKDGVWGIEKNIKTEVVDGTKGTFKILNKQDVNTNFYMWDGITDILPNSSILTDLLTNENVWNKDYEGIYVHNEIHTDNIRFRFLKTRGITFSANGITNFFKSNPMLIKYPTTQPIFIALPHSQQIALKSFANKTNIHFECEIEPTLKASVPKSLGASVSSHSEQIDNLGKELDKVKKLEESTVSTVTTESDFTTVENTSNGYFEDVKIEGRTLVNLCNNTNVEWGYTNTNSGFALGGTRGITYNITNIDTSKKYTVNVSNLGKGLARLFVGEWDSEGNAIEPTKNSWDTFIRKPIIYPNKDCYRLVVSIICDEEIELTLDNALIKYKPIVLEGDHTQNPPEFFEGLKSVGQDVDEITIATTNAPMFFGKGGKK